MKTVLWTMLAVVMLFAGCNLNKVSTSTGSDDVALPSDTGAVVMENIVIVGYREGYRADAISLIKSIDSGASVRADLTQVKAISFKTTLGMSALKKALTTKLAENDTLAAKFAYIEPSYQRALVEAVKNSSSKIVDSVKSGKTVASHTVPSFYDDYQWDMRNISAPTAWNAGLTGSGITVAVIDTGVDGTHPDLTGQTVEGYRPLTGETIPAGTDCSYGGAHGTHVSGTIAALNDGEGVIGVAPSAKIMPILIFDTTAGTYDGDYVGDDLVSEGILWAAAHGARVFSNSWGGKGYSSLLAATIAYVMEEYNGVFVASAGNDHTDEIHYPSCYPGVINVAASDVQDEIVQFSTRGQWVTVAAPGDYTILSTVPLWDSSEFFDLTNPYALYGGTSMATPHVTGTIALALEKLDAGSESYTPYQIRKLVADTADDIMASGFDNDAGWGRINAGKAVATSLGSDEGATLTMLFNSPYAYVTLYPASASVPVYYGKADDTGYLSIAGIEPGDYTLYAGSGDAWYAGTTVESTVAFTESVSLSNGDNAISVNF